MNLSRSWLTTLAASAVTLSLVACGAAPTEPTEVQEQASSAVTSGTTPAPMDDSASGTSGTCVPKSQFVACLDSCGIEPVSDGCGGTIDCPILTGATCCRHLHGTWLPPPHPLCVLQ
jgi:hypothetical protein